MVDPSPPIDKRTAADIAQQVEDLLTQYLENNGKPQGISAALINIFARYNELLITRLNQVPDKNFLAFLNLLGASRLPPQPASVPLTFLLAQGTTVDTVIPQNTQVAAPPSTGNSEPIIFETERELIATSIQLDAIFVRDPEQDTWQDLVPLINPNNTLSLPMFRGDQWVEHSLYLGHSELLNLPVIDSLTVRLTLKNPLQDDARVVWEVWQEIDKKEEWVEKYSGTLNPMTNLGNITTIPLQVIHHISSRWLRCRLLTPITLSKEVQQGMVRVQELPIIKNIDLLVNINRSKLLINSAFTNIIPLELSQAFFPFGEKPKFGDTFYFSQPEAFSKDGATIVLYFTYINLVLFEQFGKRDGEIIELSEDDIKEISATLFASLTLQWEIWAGKWVNIGTSNQEKNGSHPKNARDFTDETRAFTFFKGNFISEEPIPVKFTLLPETQPILTVINGVESFWMRVRIIQGDYGKESGYQLEDGRLVFKPATFAPPIITKMTVDYGWDKVDKPEVILTYNDQQYSKVKEDSVIPFTSIFENDQAKPTLYLGFKLPNNREKFLNTKLSLFFQPLLQSYSDQSLTIFPHRSRLSEKNNQSVTHQFRFLNLTQSSTKFTISIVGSSWNNTSPFSFSLNRGESRLIPITVTIPDEDHPLIDQGFMIIKSTENPSQIHTAIFETYTQKLPPEELIQLSWQYSDEEGWQNLIVQDETKNFRRSGLVELLPPTDFTPRSDFGLSPHYWLRIQWQKGDYFLEPQLEKILLNTTLAKQTLTLENEILGSSDGSENQTFRTVRQPILEGQQLEVREPESPTALELEKLEKEEGKNVITPVESDGKSKEVWVRWHPVTDFYASRPRDRHYILNAITGEIQFSNNINGLIPPPGVGNIRLRKYQTGGSQIGNVLAGVINQLKTTIPYVDKVINYSAAAGGADAESLTSLKERMPRTVRHQYRAVTREDYEDLAKLASPAVFRSKCFPLVDLNRNPLEIQAATLGNVSVIIVPTSVDPKPLPSLELIDRVQQYLEKHSLATATITVVGPLYIQVSIDVEVAVTLEQTSTIAESVNQTLKGFLHPLTGGFDGRGWDFGREPYDSDLYNLLEKVRGVDHIRHLNITKKADPLPLTPLLSELPNSPDELLTKVTETKRFLVYSGTHTIRLRLLEP